MIRWLPSAAVDAVNEEGIWVIVDRSGFIDALHTPGTRRFAPPTWRRRVGFSAAGLTQHPDERRPQRPVLLAGDHWKLSRRPGSPCGRWEAVSLVPWRLAEPQPRQGDRC